MAEEGVASLGTIEETGRETMGASLGPFELMNVTGIPIAFHSQSSLHRAFGAAYAPSKRLEEQFRAGVPWDWKNDSGRAREEGRGARPIPRAHHRDRGPAGRGRRRHPRGRRPGRDCGPPSAVGSVRPAEQRGPLGRAGPRGDLRRPLVRRLPGRRGAARAGLPGRAPVAAAVGKGRTARPGRLGTPRPARGVELPQLRGAGPGRIDVRRAGARAGHPRGRPRGVLPRLRRGRRYRRDGEEDPRGRRGVRLHRTAGRGTGGTVPGPGHRARGGVRPGGRSRGSRSPRISSSRRTTPSSASPR